MWKCHACQIEMEDSQNRCVSCDALRVIAQKDIIRYRSGRKIKMSIIVAGLVLALAVSVVALLPGQRLRAVAEKAVRTKYIHGEIQSLQAFATAREMVKIGDKQWMIRVGSRGDTNPDFVYYVWVDASDKKTEVLMITKDKQEILEAVAP